MERTFALRSLVAAALMALTLTLFAGMASAQDYGPQPTPSTGVTTPDPPEDPDEDVSPNAVTRDDPLPVTGSDLAGIGVIGGGLVLIGGGVLIARRRTA
jgi:LPXTG-motif cell wall-anchored protein